jgi:hypothetical protein
VYGPCESALKPLFLAELASIAGNVSGPWAVLGDFNLLQNPTDRSNNNFDARDADLFNSWINDAGLIEIPLLDRLFTWSNNQPSPILARLDRVLVNTMWNSVLPDSSLHSFTRATSDHVPLLSASSTTPKPAIFRFSNHWISHVSFGPLVTSNWLSVGSPETGALYRSCLGKTLPSP